MKSLSSILVAFLLCASAPAAEDALAEVNAARAARGLKPFLRDAGLTTGAMRAADHRAARGIKGHTANDFTYLPQGCQASAAGCAAWRPGDG